MRKLLLLLLLIPACLHAQQTEVDWVQFGRYAQANAALSHPPKALFMGDSITEYWYDTHPDFFTSQNYLSRGIAGQVTSQMLIRLRADAIALHPEAVFILAGTNDLARNKGFVTREHIIENIVSMAELLHAAGIRPILCSILPVNRFHWRPQAGDVSQTIRELNTRLAAYASERGFGWVDYHSAMEAEDGGMKPEYTTDGVHVSPAGYALMEQIATAALAR